MIGVVVFVQIDRRCRYPRPSSIDEVDKRKQSCPRPGEHSTVSMHSSLKNCSIQLRTRVHYFDILVISKTLLRQLAQKCTCFINLLCCLDSIVRSQYDTKPIFNDFFGLQFLFIYAYLDIARFWILWIIYCKGDPQMPRTKSQQTLDTILENEY